MSNFIPNPLTPEQIEAARCDLLNEIKSCKTIYAVYRFTKGLYDYYDFYTEDEQGLYSITNMIEQAMLVHKGFYKRDHDTLAFKIPWRGTSVPHMELLNTVFSSLGFAALRVEKI